MTVKLDRNAATCREENLAERKDREAGRANVKLILSFFDL